MEEQIKRIYEKQTHGRMKLIGILLLIYAALICIVSIFKGNPFPHRETVLFFNVDQPGWSTTDPWLVWVCAVLALIAGVMITIRSILRDFTPIDRILLQECDAEKYLEMMEGMITYGKSLNEKGFQKNILLVAEPKYITALIANGNLQKAEEYIRDEWEGSRKGRFRRQAAVNLELEKEYQAQNGTGYSDTLKKAGKIFQKNPLFRAKDMMLNGKEEEAVRILEANEQQWPYYEVARRFLLGVCYGRTGKEQQEKECMEYVIAHGNTTNCRKEAEKQVGR